MEGAETVKVTSDLNFLVSLFFSPLFNAVHDFFEISPDCYWWKGQNKRTCEVGTFPRHCVDPQRKLAGWSIDTEARSIIDYR